MPRRRDKRAKADQETAAAAPKRITPVDIQQKEFRLAMRGYHEQDVDQFLDEVTEEFARLHAENKRLREELEFAGTRHLDVGGAQEAEAILRRARDEAERLLAEARGRISAASASAASSSDLAPFIVREREFLQGLADLIQSHAEGVKEQLRRARGGTATTAAAPAAPTPAPAPVDEPTRPWTMEAAAHDAGSTSTWPAETSDESESDEPKVVEPGAAQRETPEIAGQDWTQYYMGPASSMQPSASFAAVPDDDVVDLTGEPSEIDDAGDRSLRELFWGED
jgi:DivIVA domain-containing protein